MEFSRQEYWSAIPFSKGSSQPRDWTWVSCTAGGFLTVWGTVTIYPFTVFVSLNLKRAFSEPSYTVSGNVNWYSHYGEQYAAAAAAKSLQSCPTLCDPIDGSLPASPVPGILQARTLEWVAISFSNAWKWKVKVKSLSHVRLLVTPWTAAYQAPLSMGFSRQGYWSGVPLPSPCKATILQLKIL